MFGLSLFWRYNKRMHFRTHLYKKLRPPTKLAGLKDFFLTKFQWLGKFYTFLYHKIATDEYKGLIFAPFKAFLFILSVIYGFIIKILIAFYRIKPYRLDCKVISVGNLTLGGTGKTSLVEFIAKYLKQRGYKVAILTRGYKRKITSNDSRTTSHETMGDEPYMLFKRLGDIPVIIDADRIRAAKQAIRDYAVDMVILDDGFQQWRIKKDLEILTIDATNPFGNRQLIPRGILREPLSSLKRADVFILTKTNIMPNVVNQAVSLRHPEATLQRDTTFGNPDIQKIKDFLNSINPRVAIIESVHKPVGFYRIDKNDELLNTDILRGKTVTLVSGIAEPGSFESLITSLDINIGLSFRFPDHHRYLESDLEKIIKESKNKNINTVITTEKDAVRLSPYLLPTTYLPCRQAGYLLDFLVLRIELKMVKNEQEFLNRLLRLYNP